MTSKEQAAGPFGLSEVEGPSTPLGVNGPESVLFVRSEVEGRLRVDRRFFDLPRLFTELIHLAREILDRFFSRREFLLGLLDLRLQLHLGGVGRVELFLHRLEFALHLRELTLDRGR